MTYEEGTELREAADRAASAPVSPDCEADQHGTYTAYRRKRCRCPETVELNRLLRRQWDTPTWQRKSLAALIQRHSVRPEVVEAILDGRRHEVRSTFAERDAAFHQAVKLWGRDAHVIAAKLGYGRHEAQRRLNRLLKQEEESAQGE